MCLICTRPRTFATHNFSAMRELSVVITVMNEEDNIYPLVKAIQGALAGIDYEIVFVDDGSQDATREPALKM